MKITFHLAKGAKHQELAAQAMFEGMRKHGLNPEIAPHNTFVNSDLCFIWSWKQPDLIKHIDYQNHNIIVMERGYFPDRDNWVSLTMNGFHGRGKYAPARDNGEKFTKHWGRYLEPWKINHNGYVLLAGQVPGDPTIFGLDINEWLNDQAKKLTNMGYKVRLRLHPFTMKKIRDGFQVAPDIKNCELSLEPNLYKDLDGANFVVTFSSTIANDALLYGVPCVAYDECCLAYPITGHSLERNQYRPDRTQWCNDMAWRQWSHEEMKSGLAWEHSRQVLPEKFH